LSIIWSVRRSASIAGNVTIGHFGGTAARALCKQKNVRALG
jgi:hypothetical protein